MSIKGISYMFSRSKKQHSPGEQMSTPSTGDVSKMLRAAGRVGLSSLRKIAQENGAETFEQFLKLPVLAGSAIRARTLSDLAGKDQNSMYSTRVLELPDSESAVSESLKQAIYPLLRGTYGTVSRNTFSIGRTDNNDIITPDFGISKRHAEINSEDDTYYLRDLSSTNGTTVNGRPLEGHRVAIKDGDVIGFARYEFLFLYPHSFYEMLREGSH
jgi:hypothetical protein